MSEQDKDKVQPESAAPEGSAPPKQVPFKPIQATAAPAGDGPIRRPVLRRPGEAPAEKPVSAPEPEAPAVSARKTTRIDLPQDVLEAQDSGEFKTVKLRPTPPPQPGSSPLPSGPKPPSQAQVQASKSKTTRISLEAAFGADEDKGASAAPKTIRLKRPSELTKTTTSAIAMTPEGAAPATVPGSAAQRSQTARLPTQQLVEATGEEDEGSTPTRRRTIKIKRPTATPGVKISVGGKAPAKASFDDPEEDEELLPLVDGRLPVADTGPDGAHIGFVLSAVAVLLVTVGIVWILAAQAFGPNAAVTGYTRSWGANIAPPPGLVSVD